MTTRTCENCGLEYDHMTYSRGVYCSSECRNAHMKSAKRKAEPKRLTAEQLEEAANRLLYGSASVPKTRNGELYLAPKKIVGKIVCADCGKPRSHLSGALCLACYRLRGKKKQKATLDADTYHYFLDGGGAEGRELRINAFGEDD